MSTSHLLSVIMLNLEVMVKDVHDSRCVCSKSTLCDGPLELETEMQMPVVPMLLVELLKVDLSRVNRHI